MYTIKTSEFTNTGVDNAAEILVDISQLRDFTALDLADANLLMYKYGFTLEQMQSLIKSSDTEFIRYNEGVREPIMLPVNAYKLGRILAKNAEFIQLDNDVESEVYYDISNGMFYELGIPKAKSSLTSQRQYNFKLKYNGGYQYA